LAEVAGTGGENASAAGRTSLRGKPTGHDLMSLNVTSRHVVFSSNDFQIDSVATGGPADLFVSRVEHPVLENAIEARPHRGRSGRVFLYLRSSQRVNLSAAPRCW